MSQENVEIVRRSWEMWERGDLTGLLELMSDDLAGAAAPVWTTPHSTERGTSRAGFGVERGVCRVVGGGRGVHRRGGSSRGPNHQTARGEASGVPIEMDVWFVTTVSQRKVVRVDMFVNEQEALEAVGLSE